jgi:hypothetical protein
MPHGISTNRRLTSLGGCVRAAGHTFVCRYYSRTTKQPQKVLTRDEALALTAADVQIVAVYEDAPLNPAYFSRQRGRADAVGAVDLARAVGQPAGSALYFAVDYDATADATTGAITEYFRGVQEGLASRAASYVIGVYGSGRVCARIKDDLGLAALAWLAESTGWAGSSTYTTWDIRQAVSTTALCGLPGGLHGGYEDNVARGPFGAFGVAGAAPVPAPPPAAPAVAVLPPTPFATRLIGLARDQYDRYHQLTESDAPLREQIRAYWEELGFDFPGVSTPWSAVFVSWLMHTAGATAAEFRPSTAHSRFVFAAIQNANANTGVFHGRRIEEYPPKPGDLLHANRRGQRLTFDFAAAHQGYESHSAVVVELASDAGGRFVRTIGGNESDTVSLKRVALTTEGFVQQRPVDPYICVVQNLK